MTVAGTLALLAGRERSAAELVDELLVRAGDHRDLGAWELLDAEAPRRAAAEADAARARGDMRPLLGVPVAVKDVVDVAGLPTTAGAARWVRHPSRDAAAVAALRAAGAVVLGKTATVEFAYGIDGSNPHRPPVRNPRAPDRLPGGSSSGSAVAVAAALAPAALGTDTSGSLRVPAALCGVVGLRPSAGRVPVAGVVPLAPSYDVVGPLTATVADAALLFAVLAGVRPAPRARPVAGSRIGVLEALVDAAHPDVAAALRACATRLAAAGARVRPVAVPGLEDALAVHRTVQLREAAAVHAALGTRAEDAAPEIGARLRAGAALAPAAVARARRARGVLARAVDAALTGHDALLAPAAAVVAPPRETDEVEVSGGRRVPLRDALLACPVPLTQHGGPVLALPVAAGPGGLPIGAQLAGPRGGDEALLALAEAVHGPMSDGASAMTAC